MTERLIYASCRRGIDEPNSGFQVFNRSAGISDRAKNELIIVGDYNLSPTNLDTHIADSSMAESYPVAFRYVYLPDRSYMTRTRFLGPDWDYSRFGSNILIVGAELKEPWSAYPMEYHNSGFINIPVKFSDLGSAEPAKMLDTVKVPLPPDGDIGYGKAFDFASRGKQAGLASLLSTMYATDGIVKFSDSHSNCELWIAAATMILPLKMAAKVSFSTYGQLPKGVKGPALQAIWQDGEGFSIEEQAATTEFARIYVDRMMSDMGYRDRFLAFMGRNKLDPADVKELQDGFTLYLYSTGDPDYPILDPSGAVKAAIAANPGRYSDEVLARYIEEKLSGPINPEAVRQCRLGAGSISDQVIRNGVLLKCDNALAIYIAESLTRASDPMAVSQCRKDAEGISDQVIRDDVLAKSDERAIALLSDLRGRAGADKIVGNMQFFSGAIERSMETGKLTSIANPATALVVLKMWESTGSSETADLLSHCPDMPSQDIGELVGMIKATSGRPILDYISADNPLDNRIKGGILKMMTSEDLKGQDLDALMDIIKDSDDPGYHMGLFISAVGASCSDDFVKSYLECLSGDDDNLEKAVRACLKGPVSRYGLILESLAYDGRSTSDPMVKEVIELFNKNLSWTSMSEDDKLALEIIGRSYRDYYDVVDRDRISIAMDLSSDELPSGFGTEISKEDVPDITRALLESRRRDRWSRRMLGLFEEESDMRATAAGTVCGYIKDHPDTMLLSDMILAMLEWNMSDENVKEAMGIAKEMGRDALVAVVINVKTSLSDGSPQMDRFSKFIPDQLLDDDSKDKRGLFSFARN